MNKMSMLFTYKNVSYLSSAKYSQCERHSVALRKTHGLGIYMLVFLSQTFDRAVCLFICVACVAFLYCIAVYKFQ